MQPNNLLANQFSDQLVRQLNLSAEERNYYSQLFHKIDQGYKGKIGGHEAAQLFKSSKLPDQLLATVSFRLTLSKKYHIHLNGRYGKEQIRIRMDY